MISGGISIDKTQIGKYYYQILLYYLPILFTESTSDKKQISKFIKEYIAPESFKNSFEKLVLDAAREGRFTAEFALNACDRAIVMTLDECRENKDVNNEDKTRMLMKHLHRKVKSAKKDPKTKTKEERIKYGC